MGGFDALRTLNLVGIDEIEIENRKAPGSLNGAPYLQGVPLPEDRENDVFSGTAREAIAAFPKNVNVAVASALAASDPDQAKVRIHSVPGMTRNTHIIRAGNALGAVTLQFDSCPDPKNPRSSTITAWSTAALLRELASPVRFF